MVPQCRAVKTRTTWPHSDRDDVTVAFDNITGLGSCVEGEVRADDSEAAAALLGQVEQQLGLTDLPVVRLPHRDLALRQATPG